MNRCIPRRNKRLLPIVAIGLCLVLAWFYATHPSESNAFQLLDKRVDKLASNLLGDGFHATNKTGTNRPGSGNPTFVTRRNISVSSSFRADDRFREEIVGYHRLGLVQSPCAAPTRTATSSNVSTPNVRTQEVYANCTSARVPNIVHQVWLYGTPREFGFIQLLSALSMIRYIKPCLILFWYDGHAPVGENWHQFVGNVTAHRIPMEMLQVTSPQSMWGKKINFPEHKSDIIRFEAVKHFGGIYMDFDVMLVRDLEPLRCYDFTIGRETPEKLTTNLLLSVPHAPFLEKIIDHYKAYSQVWTHNSVEYPHQLSRKFPGLIHIEEKSINRPNWRVEELKTLFGTSCSIDLTARYAIHLWLKVSSPIFHLENVNASSIKMMHSTFGKVARTIYYMDAGNC